MQLRTRPLRAGDRHAIAELLRDTQQFRESEVDVALELFDLGVAVTGDAPRDPSYHLAGAEHDGELAGFVCYGPTPASDATYDLYWIAVRRAMQGRGVGSALLRHVEAEVQRAGGRLIVIETSGSDHYGSTRAFYERVGYHEAARLRDFYAVGEDRLVLTRRLAPPG